MCNPCTIWYGVTCPTTCMHRRNPWIHSCQAYVLGNRGNKHQDILAYWNGWYWKLLLPILSVRSLTRIKCWVLHSSALVERVILAILVLSVLPWLIKLAKCSPAAFQALVGILEHNPNVGSQMLHSQFVDLILGWLKLLCGPWPQTSDHHYWCIGWVCRIRKLLLSYYLSSLSMHQSCTSSSLLQAVLSNKLGIGLISQSLESIPNLFFMMLKKMWWQQYWTLYQGSVWRNFPWRRNELLGDSWPSEDQFKTLVHHAGKLSFMLQLYVNTWRRNKCYRPSGCCNWYLWKPSEWEDRTLDNCIITL